MLGDSATKLFFNFQCSSENHTWPVLAEPAAQETAPLTNPAPSEADHSTVFLSHGWFSPCSHG